METGTSKSGTNANNNVAPSNQPATNDWLKMEIPFKDKAYMVTSFLNHISKIVDHFFKK